YQHVHNEPKPLAEIRPDLPTELCGIVHKMMAKKPENRYQTAGEIAREVHRLRDALNLGNVAAVSMSLSSVSGSGSHAQADSTPRSAWTWRAIGLACVIIALAGGLTIGVYQRHLTNPVIDPIVPLTAVDDLSNAKALLKERERALKERVEETLKP